jgi:hypothetical protein
MRLRRLTADEYSHTIEDLLGDTSNPGRRFAGDAVGPSGFATAGLIAGLEFRQHMEAAEQVAAGAALRLEKLLPCDPAAGGEDRCASQFIETFGRRAYRRKLAAGEVTALSVSPAAMDTASRRWLSRIVPPGLAVRYSRSSNSAFTAAWTAGVFGVSLIVMFRGFATGKSTVAAQATGRT